MDFIDLLPYMGAGGGAAIPFIFWRLAYLEGEFKAKKLEVQKLNKNFNLVYFYLSKKDTNFANFMEKHQRL